MQQQVDSRQTPVTQKLAACINSGDQLIQVTLQALNMLAFKAKLFLQRLCRISYQRGGIYRRLLAPQLAAYLTLDPGKVIFKDTRIFSSRRKPLNHIAKEAGERLGQDITRRFGRKQAQRVVVPDFRSITKVVQ